MRDVLNPTLYGLLCRRFGENNVQPVNQGIEIVWHATRQLIAPGKERVKMVVDISGEEYKVSCPFCSDTRSRLLINHRWGAWHEDSESLNLWLANCYNESCLSDFDTQKQLYEMLFTTANVRKNVQIKPGKKLDLEEVIEVAPPGPMVRVDELAKTKPGHPAIRYLATDRGFDVDYLGKTFGISYCQYSHFTLASNRIIIPIYENLKLAGWQARYIGDDVNGQTFKQAKLPKYWGAPMMAKRLLGYNFERATQYPTCVIVEGPTDVWSFGLPAIAVLGKTMTPQLRKKLVFAMRKHGDAGVVAVMLDPEQDETAKRKGRPHHIEQLVNQLSVDGALPGQVVPIYLPFGLDPGSTARSQLRKFVAAECLKKGLKVNFKRNVN
jgi:hypothetical protein